VPWPEPIFLFQLDLHDAANNIKHYANIDHGMLWSELFDEFLNASISYFSNSARLWSFMRFFDNKVVFNALLDFTTKTYTA
jgi:hypothetical protein